MKTYEERLPLIDAAIQCDMKSFYDKYELLADRLIYTPMIEYPQKSNANWAIYKKDTNEFVGTVDELEQRKAELQNKPSWADAPEWAEWLAQDEDGQWAWYQAEPTPCQAGCPWWYVEDVDFLGLSAGTVIGNWQDTLEKRPDSIVHSEHQSEHGSLPTECVIEEQPMKYEYGKEYVCNGKRPEGLGDDVHVGVKMDFFDGIAYGFSGYVNWSKAQAFHILDERFKPDPSDWHKRGELPPVGTMVEIADIDGLMYGHGESGEVIAHVENSAVVRMSYGLGCFTVKALRPLRTETDKLLEQAKRDIGAFFEESDIHAIKELIAKGWRPTEGDK